ncbi:MAG: heparinase II/III family protein [Lachnospiraceae bacterium]|nr:heparinase II/III family protein [Lachnospiraceae bacterium]
MIQFTREEVERLREKSGQYKETIQKLKEDASEVFLGKILVPKTGIANWSQFFYCPDCSVKLTIDRNSAHLHTCPSCGKTFSGEPYDSSWWGNINQSNYNSIFRMAIIWLAAGEEAYARKAIEIMMEYAAHYPDYEIHGNIPYNGPGRVGAQTLDEANFQRTMARAYDILSECMTEEEKNLVRDNMFLPGARFLLEYRHRQLHNHEVIINSAIAIIGMLFENQELIDAGLYDDYGILYQLEHGMQDNKMWFEGTFGYHFYALESFFDFEKFALHTKYSHIHHPNYRKMMDMVYDYLDAGKQIPMINDTTYVQTAHMKQDFEFPYRELGGEKLAYILNSYYEDRSRDNLEAFLYGAEIIEPVSGEPGNYHTEIGKPGHTILRGSDGRYLLFKHDRYGGEHDHYDRLGISYQAYGKPVSRDLGTTGYGAVMHYDYYKNTGAHNTMVIGEENQAPADGRLTRYEEKDGVIYVEAEADWTDASFQMPDSFTIVQWSEENYRPVTMKRKLAWTDSYFAEVFVAENVPEGLTADWVMHFAGTLLNDAKEKGNAGERTALPEGYFKKKPFKYLHDGQICPAETGGCYRKTYQDGEVYTTVYGMKNGQIIITAAGPDNPSAGEISYLLERRQGRRAVCAHVVESWKEEAHICAVSFQQEENQIEIRVTERDGQVKIVQFLI